MRQHGREVLPDPNQVPASIMHRLSERASGDRHHHHAALGMKHLLDAYPELNPLEDPMGDVMVSERQGAQHPAGLSVGDPENQATAPLVRQGHAVLHEFIDIDGVRPMFELEMLVFACQQPLVDLCWCRHRELGHK